MDLCGAELPTREEALTQGAEENRRALELLVHRAREACRASAPPVAWVAYLGAALRVGSRAESPPSVEAGPCLAPSPYRGRAAASPALVAFQGRAAGLRGPCPPRAAFPDQAHAPHREPSQRQEAFQDPSGARRQAEVPGAPCQAAADQGEVATFLPAEAWLGAEASGQWEACRPFRAWGAAERNLAPLDAEAEGPRSGPEGVLREKREREREHALEPEHALEQELLAGQLRGCSWPQWPTPSEAPACL